MNNTPSAVPATAFDDPEKVCSTAAKFDEQPQIGCTVQQLNKLSVGSLNAKNPANQPCFAGVSSGAPMGATITDMQPVPNPKQVKKHRNKGVSGTFNEYSDDPAQRAALDCINGVITQKELQRRYQCEYQTWHGMRYIRTNPDHPDWSDEKFTRHPEFDKFAQFLLKVGETPSPKYLFNERGVPVRKWTLDCIDPNGKEYGPNKVRWLDAEGQSANRRNTRMLFLPMFNKHLPWTEWSKRFGVNKKTFSSVLERFLKAEPSATADGIEVHLIEKGIIPPAASQASAPVPPTKKIKEPSKGDKRKELCSSFNSRWRIFTTDENIDFHNLTQNDYSNLTIFAAAFPPNDVLEGLDICLGDWRKFTTLAEDEEKAFNPPDFPTTAFLCKYAQVAYRWLSRVNKAEQDRRFREAAEQARDTHNAKVRIPTIAGSQTNRWRAADPTDRGQLRGWAVWFMPPLTGGCIVGAEVALVQAS